jgi:hypothetical protein
LDEWLVIVAGPAQGRRIPVRDGLVVGRAPECGFSLNDEFASHRHFRLAICNGRVVVEDLGSGNGTKVNGRQVTNVALQPDDIIEAGNTKMLYRSSRTRRRISPWYLVAALAAAAVGMLVSVTLATRASRQAAELEQRRTRAVTLEAQGNHRDALAEYQWLARRRPASWYSTKVARLTQVVAVQSALEHVALLADAHDSARARYVLDSIATAYPSDQDVLRTQLLVRQGMQRFVVVARARLLAQRQRFREAVGVLDSLGRSMPDPHITEETVAILLGQARGLERRLKAASARVVYSEVLARAPDNKEAAAALARLPRRTE